VTRAERLGPKGSPARKKLKKLGLAIMAASVVTAGAVLVLLWKPVPPEPLAWSERRAAIEKRFDVERWNLRVGVATSLGFALLLGTGGVLFGYGVGGKSAGQVPCRSCRTLNDKAARSCKQCAAKMS
jgi:hypothetical protein